MCYRAIDAYSERLNMIPIRYHSTFVLITWYEQKAPTPRCDHYLLVPAFRRFLV